MVGSKPLPKPIELVYRTWGSHHQHRKHVLVLVKENGERIEWQVPTFRLNGRSRNGRFAIKSRRIPELQGELIITDSNKNLNRRAMITAVPSDVVKIYIKEEYCSSKKCRETWYEYDMTTGEIRQTQEVIETIEVD